MTEVCILTTNQSICSGKLGSCGIQVDFQNQCDGFLMWKKKIQFWSKQTCEKNKVQIMERGDRTASNEKKKNRNILP